MINIPSPNNNGDVIKLGNNLYTFEDGKLKPLEKGIGGSTLPEYLLGEEILTTDRWINGKPLYRKVIDCGALPNAATKNVQHNITDMELAVKCYGVTTTATTGVLNLPFVDPRNSTYNVRVTAYNTSSAIVLITGNDKTDFINTYVAIEYTKTTDTASSPVAVIGNGGYEPDIITGVETLAGYRRNGKQVYQIEVDFGALPNATTKTVPIPDYNPSYTYWIDVRSTYYIKDGVSVPACFIWNTNNYMTIWLETSNVFIITSLNRTDYNGFVVLNYTK